MAWTILYSVRDAKGEVSTTEINAPSSVSLTNIGAFAKAMAVLINPIITGAITRIGICLSVALPAGIRSTPVAHSDVEEGARFQFRTVGSYITALRLPTFLETLIQSNSRAVDTEDSDVAAFVTAMVSGVDVSGQGGTGTISSSDKREADVTSLETAKEQFLSSRS